MERLYRRIMNELLDQIVRGAIQGALLAAPRVERGDLDELSQILGQMRASSRGGNGATDRTGVFLDAETTFHHLLMASSGNRFLVSTLRYLHPSLARVRLR